MNWKRDRHLQRRMVLAFALALLGYAALLGVVLFFFSTTVAVVVCGALVVFLVVSITQADRIAYLATRAIAVDREAHPTLYETVDRLANQAGMSTPPLAVIPSSEPNALSAGSGDRAVICVTLGLVKTLEEDELEAVLAHELAHLKNNDSTVMTVAGFPMTVASIAFAMARQSFTWWSLFLGWPLWLALYLAFVSLPVYIVSLPGTLVLSRYREYAADRGAVAITGDPWALASALATLHDAPTSPDEDLRQVASFNAFCVVPTEAMFPHVGTHPPTHERIEKLRELASELEAR